MKTIFLNILILLSGSPCFAGGTEGATPFNFLFMDTARAAAMGEAYSAIQGGAETLLYNPAGLSKIENNEIIFGYASHIKDINQKYLGIAFKKGYGAMIKSVYSDKIQRTTISNPTGMGLGEFEIKDWLLSIGYGKLYKDGLIGFGIAGKYISESIDDYTAEAVAMDWGIIISMENYDLPMFIGFAMQNIGTKPKFQSQREDLPVNVKAGISWKFLKGLLLADINTPKNGENTFHVGAEYKVIQSAVIRLGYNGRNETDSGITFGCGLEHKKYEIDYAFSPYGELGNTHILSLKVKI